MRFIEDVNMVFKIRGRGCVIAPGIPIDFKPSIKAGSILKLINPNGTIVNSTLQSVEMINTDKALTHLPFSLDASTNKNDIQIGAKIYLIECNE